MSVVSPEFKAVSFFSVFTELQPVTETKRTTIHMLAPVQNLRESLHCMEVRLELGLVSIEDVMNDIIRAGGCLHRDPNEGPAFITIRDGDPSHVFENQYWLHGRRVAPPAMPSRPGEQAIAPERNCL